jgi:hypothetical protein
MGGNRVFVGGPRLCRESRQLSLDNEHGVDTLSTSQVIPPSPSSCPFFCVGVVSRLYAGDDAERVVWGPHESWTPTVDFLLILRRYAHCAPTDFNSMIRLVNGSLTQVTVWIDCPRCGRYQKLVREVELPLEVVTPMLERACAVCDHCRGSAVMCFERKVSRLH